MLDQTQDCTFEDWTAGKEIVPKMTQITEADGQVTGGPKKVLPGGAAEVKALKATIAEKDAEIEELKS